VPVKSGASSGGNDPTSTRLVSRHPCQSGIAIDDPPDAVRLQLRRIGRSPQRVSDGGDLDERTCAVTDPAARYFPPALDCPTYVDDTEWIPLVDAEVYFTELDSQLRRARAGDTLLIAGLEIDPSIDLQGRSESDPGHLALGEQLALLAADGVDVRLLIAGRAFASSVPWGGGLGPFRENARVADDLRRLRVAGTAAPPLAGRVLLDFSGAMLGSNHQKAVVAHIGGELTSFVGGIDLSANRFDAGPHDRLRLDGERWGWHDMAVRLRGEGARRVWEIFRQRWQETLTLPNEHYLRTPVRRRRLNPRRALPAPGPAPDVVPAISPGVAVRVLRSTYRRKIESRLPFKRRNWDALPDAGAQEVFRTVVTALSAAERYIYIEDQYLEESLGGDAAFELYPYLLAAAMRGVKVILLGSGTRDPDDPGPHPGPINQELNADLKTKLVDPLPPELRENVAVYRLENCTVHAKLILIDDAFANIGSAHIFSRSMMGTDSEMSAAVATSTTLVRDLRVALWGEHLRAPLKVELTSALEDLDLAMGIWRSAWLPEGADRSTWQTPGRPAGFLPDERALALVGPL
jgi:phosphatidylserine/phosphatidylglycerophosphate/cardiolipin synthase-like enzyme